MAHATFAKLWLEAQRDLEDVIELDRTKLLTGGPRERAEGAKISLEVYYRYRRIVKNLTDCHDQIVQPQIREVIGKMLDYTIVRMLECRRELVETTYTENPWPLDFALDRKETPDELHLTTPLYDSGARLIQIEERRAIIDEHIRKIEREQAERADAIANQSDSEVTTLSSFSSDEGDRSKKLVLPRASILEEESSEVSETSLEQVERLAREAEIQAFIDAIVRIQSHERARIGRRLALFAEKRRNQRESTFKSKAELERLKQIQNKAAVVIQKTWRGVLGRRAFNKKLADFEEVIGMTIPYWKSNKLEKRSQELDFETVDAHPRAILRLQAAIKEEKEKIWDKRGPPLIEEIRDDVFQWMMEWYEDVGVIDWIPPAKVGGSALIVTGQVRTPQEMFDQAAEVPAPPAKKEEEAEEKEPAAIDEEPKWEPRESVAMPLLLDIQRVFEEQWSFRTDQIIGCGNDLIIEMIQEDLYAKLQKEMRVKADESLRRMQHKLNNALLTDNVEEEDFSIPTPEVFTELMKKAQPPKKIIELSVKTPIEELLGQLTRWQVLEEIPESKLYDFPGVRSNPLGRPLEIRVGDLLQTVIDYCILPVASKVANEIGPYYKSIAICGPPNAGQHYLAYAVCSEMKAMVFNLTPEKHVGRFLAKKQQDSLVRAILKVAKHYAPSVVLVESEMAWLQNIPIELRVTKPKRFLSIYKRIRRGISPGDQVLFLTASGEPYKASRQFIRFHDKIIVVPFTDHLSMYAASKRQLMRHQMIDRHFDCTALARSTTPMRLPFGLAQDVVARASGIARRMTFLRKKLEVTEIFEQMLEVEKPEEAVFDKWWGRLKLEKKRRAEERAIMEEERLEKERLAKEAAGK